MTQPPEPGAIPRPTLVDVVARALAEDLGRGDVTSEATIPAAAVGAATIRAREPLVLAGVEVAREVFAQVDPTVAFDARAADGAHLAAGAAVARVAGSTRSILAGERVALNFLQRACGVASATARHVAALPEGSGTRITDTRKTTPGLRAIERHAVRCGGGHNHREDLSSAVLIKDNHVAAAGGVAEAIRRARAHAPHTSRIECEVDTLAQLDEAVAAGAEVVLLDNFDDAAVAEAVRRVAGRPVWLEASGGVTLDRIAALASLGVHAISVGRLTHSAPAADLGLDWEGAA